MATNDCGIYSITPLDSLTLRVVFVPDGGEAVPVEAEALDLTNWVYYLTPTDSTLTLAAVEKVSAYVYDLWWNHSNPVGIGISIETAAIPTDLGGWCDSPEVYGVFGIADPVSELATEQANPDTWELGPVSLDGEPWITGGTPPRRRSRRR